MKASDRLLLRYEFLPTLRANVREGDLVANHATVTRVIHGPFETNDWWGPLRRNETFIQCGSSVSMKGKSDSLLIIGRLLDAPDE